MYQREGRVKHSFDPWQVRITYAGLLLKDKTCCKPARFKCYVFQLHTEIPVPPWDLSNHNRYTTTRGHNPRCDLVLPSCPTLSQSLQGINSKSSPFRPLPVISTELTQPRCLYRTAKTTLRPKDVFLLVGPCWMAHERINNKMDRSSSYLLRWHILTNVYV